MSDTTTIQPGQYVVTVSEKGGGEKADYITLPAEEPIKANIVDIATVPGMFPDDNGNIKDQLKFSFKVAEGQEGEGQVYSMWVNAPTSSFVSPKSALYGKIISKIYVNETPEDFDVSKLLGQPIRFELSHPEPSKKDPEKTYQKVIATKSPTKDQKPVEVQQDFVPTEVISEEELDSLFPE
jgi:hypothetical protein